MTNDISGSYAEYVTAVLAGREYFYNSALPGNRNTSAMHEAARLLNCGGSDRDVLYQRYPFAGGTMFLKYHRSIVPLVGSGARPVVTADCELEGRPWTRELVELHRKLRMYEFNGEYGFPDVVEPEEIQIFSYDVGAFDGDENTFGEIWIRNADMIHSGASPEMDRLTTFFRHLRKTVLSLPNGQALDHGFHVPTRPARFRPPVASLFRTQIDCEAEAVLYRESIGSPEMPVGRHWIDYKALGLGAEHVDELIYVCDELELTVAHYPANSSGVTHAIRALGQIASPAAIEYLISWVGSGGMADANNDAFQDSDHLSAEVEAALAIAGEKAIGPLERLLTDSTADGWRRHHAAHTLAKLAVTHPEFRARVVADLCRAMENSDEDRDSVTSIAYSLVEMRAIEAADSLERGFAQGRIDEDYFGDWERTKRDLRIAAIW